MTHEDQILIPLQRLDMRDAFAHEDTAALIGDCYAFGKVACCLPMESESFSSRSALEPRPGVCGTISH